MQGIIIAAALFNHVDPNLLLSVCYQETRFKHVIVRDGKSLSYGPCQVKKIAAKEVGVNSTRISDIYVNVDVAAKFLKHSIEKCGSIESALSNYNSGHCFKYPMRNKYVNDVMKYYRNMLLYGQLQ